jgi:AraC family transcriptional regulator of adaptative response/methylated-DNA-[protein]-cysteine methyltransferase
MNKLTFKQKYNSIGMKNTYYEGVFVTAVKTTGIFCRPSCRARKPKFENVEFFDTVQQALQNGYRPCKICKPMEQLDETPDYIKSIIKELHLDPFLRIKDDDLRQRTIEPSQIRRWFKKNHNMTFHAYQRLLRINTAFSEIKKGETISNSAFDSGYESLSGFTESYHSVFGVSPSKNTNKSIINIIRFTTPIGPMFACATQKGICLLEFTDRRMLETEFKDLNKKFNAVILPGKNPHLKQVQVEILEYFNGSRKNFTVALDAPGTAFQEVAWQSLHNIPYGETRSYAQQAKALGNPKAVRAVGTANGHNRIAIIIPCHRVIASNGKLAGYGGGIHRKKWLIDFEKNNLN